MLKPKYRIHFLFSSPVFLRFYFCLLLRRSPILVIFVVIGPSAFCLLPSNAQIADSIQSSLQKKPRIIAGFATKSTFINNFRSPIFSVRAGLDFNHRIRVGAGLNMLKLSPYEPGRDNTPFYLDKTVTDAGSTYTIHPALRLRYVNLFIEYVYYKSGKWQFSIPIQFGIGGSSYSYSFNGQNIKESKHTILLYEPAVSGHYKLTKWFGIGLDVGYRIMLISDKNIGNNFNSPVYDIKAIIFFGALYKSVLGITQD